MSFDVRFVKYKVLNSVYRVVAGSLKKKL